METLSTYQTLYLKKLQKFYSNHQRSVLNMQVSMTLSVNQFKHVTST